MNPATPTAKSETEAIAALARSALQPNFLGEGTASRSSVVMFPDKTLKCLAPLVEAASPAPYRQRATVELKETRSFIAYLHAHAIPKVTRIFATVTEQGARFEAIIDYHAEQNGTAGWGEHTATLTLQTTPEWQTWIKRNRAEIPQADFAELLEDNLADIIEPDGAALLDMAQFLTGKKGATWKSGKNLKDGAITFEYSETIETTGGVSARRDETEQVPDHLVLNLCPFVGGAPVAVRTRFRFRIGDRGNLSFIYLMDRPHKVIEAAVNAARARIEEETGLPVHLGSASIKNPSAFTL
jgi:uncharacterized protein YfdQ (DUF2303 family)